MTRRSGVKEGLMIIIVKAISDKTYTLLIIIIQNTGERGGALVGCEWTPN